MTMTINQQISWIEDQLRWMKKSLPLQVASGRITELSATHRMACAQSTYATLTQLRGLVVHGKGKTE